MNWTSLLRRGVPLLFLGVIGSAQSYVVRGTLTSSVDGSPVRHGHLAATLAGDEARDARASTDADETGHFVLALPESGLWKLTAAARGFLPSALDEHGSLYTGVALGPAARSAEVAFHLVPEASLAGYVLDEAGEAVRGAQVSCLFRSGVASGDEDGPTWQRKGTARTDDRGHYDFNGLAPGQYKVAVQAQPWYAIGAQRSMSGAAQVDSSLDMAYPLTWYPGVIDQSSAGVVSLEGGGAGQADLRLFPVPALHLHVPAQTQTGDRGFLMPQVQLLWPDGGVSFQPVRPFFGPQGEMDIGGLAPGTYRIANLNGNTQPFELHISASTGKTIDLSAAVVTTAVTFRFDMPESVRPPDLRLVDTASGRSILMNESNGTPPRSGTFDGPERPMQRPSGFTGDARFARDGQQDGNERKIDLAPGRYEVLPAFGHAQYLTGFSAEEASVSGRFVVVGPNACRLTLHFAVGSSAVNGTVVDAVKSPMPGAMVLLVPASWGDPRKFLDIQRAQTNTDGSFELKDALAGQYILLAIRDGWHVDWHDPSTLRRYLLHGTPIELSATTSAHETLQAQLP